MIPRGPEVIVSIDRAELHRLVDELHEDRGGEARAVLQALTPEQVPAQPRRRLSLSGAYRSGHSDTASQAREILQEELGGLDPHGR
jgi:hypothetical protein